MTMTRQVFIWTISLSLTVGFALTSFQTDNRIDNLLKKPFDLQKFKRTKGSSNSGGATKKPYYFKPDTKGIYYHFFLFPPLSGYIYIQDDKTKKDLHSENGLAIITYKPTGKYQDDYLDPTETLIEVIAHFNDKDLPELAFVGLDTVSLKNKLGDSFLRQDNCFIYTKDKNALTLKISGKTVEWLKYTRLNFTLTKEKIPSGLLTDKN